MGRGVEVLGVGVRVLLRVELAEAETDRQLAADRLVDVVGGQQALVQGAPEASDHRRTVRAVVGEAVDAGAQRGGGRLLVGVEVVLGVDQVRRRARVRADQQVLVGPGAQMLGQIGRDVVGAAVDQVVRGHHPGHRARLDRLAEGAQVVLVQDARADRGGGGGAVGLVVVRQPVLEHGGRAPVRGVVAAQAAGVRGRDRRGQPRVLGVALLVAAPQGVAQQVDRGGPDVEADAVVAGAHRAGLGGDGLADTADEVLVPGRADPHGLWEHRRGAHPGHPVQGLLAGAEGGHPETVDGGRELVEERDLLIRGEPLEQIVDALRERQPRIAERRRGRRLCGHVGIPLRWSGEALSKRFDAHSTVGWVSRDHGATDPFPHRHTGRDSDGRKGVFRSSTPPRNLGIDPCAPPVVHLTSQQHRSASTAEGNASRAHLPLLFISSIASAQPVPLKTPQPTATAGCPGVRHEGLTQ